MPAKSTGKRRSTKDSKKRQRYRSERRIYSNKIRRMFREINRLARIKRRSPESKVDRNIEDLNKRIKDWKTK